DGLPAVRGRCMVDSSASTSAPGSSHSSCATFRTSQVRIDVCRDPHACHGAPPDAKVAWCHGEPSWHRALGESGSGTPCNRSIPPCMMGFGPNGIATRQESEMPAIVADNLVKDFTRTKPVAGRFSAARTLFSRQQETIRAVGGVSFSVDAGEVVG